MVQNSQIRISVLCFCALVLGCSAGPPPGASSPPAGEDSDAGLGGQATCTAPQDLPADPLVLRGRVDALMMELLDVRHDPSRNLVFAAGGPGLVALVADSSDGGLLGSFALEQSRRFDRLELLDDSMIALTVRANPGVEQQGLFVVDSSDLMAMELVSSLPLLSPGAMRYQAPYLYVLSLEGRLHTIDMSEPSLPVQVHELGELGSPWALWLDGDRGWIADNHSGLIALDLSDPAAPQAVGSHETAGKPTDIVGSADALFVALGSRGIEHFDLQASGAPHSQGVLELGGAVYALASSGGRVWASDHRSLFLLEVGATGELQSLGREPLPSWAMRVDASGVRAWVANWDGVAIVDHASDSRAPDLQLSHSALHFPSGYSSRRVSLANQGAAELALLRLEVSDPRVGLALDTLVLSPGEAAELTVDFAGEGEALAAVLCIASNDPDAPVQEVEIVSAGPAGANIAVGDPAPNFLLPDLDGQVHELDGQLGYPVLLSYFATW